MCAISMYLSMKAVYFPIMYLSTNMLLKISYVKVVFIQLSRYRTEVEITLPPGLTCFLASFIRIGFARLDLIQSLYERVLSH